MEFFKPLLVKLGLWRPRGSRRYALDDQLYARIGELARQEQLPEDELTTSLLSSALAGRQTLQELEFCWQSLTRREQDVAALACLGCTNREIASRLGVAPSTVKTHLRNVLGKFGLHKKTELSLVLHDWDFSAWDRSTHR